MPRSGARPDVHVGVSENAGRWSQRPVSRAFSLSRLQPLPEGSRWAPASRPDVPNSQAAQAGASRRPVNGSNVPGGRRSTPTSTSGLVSEPRRAVNGPHVPRTRQGGTVQQTRANGSRRPTLRDARFSRSRSRQDFGGAGSGPTDDPNSCEFGYHRVPNPGRNLNRHLCRGFSTPDSDDDYEQSGLRPQSAGGRTYCPASEASWSLVGGFCPPTPGPRGSAPLSETHALKGAEPPRLRVRGRNPNGADLSS